RSGLTSLERCYAATPVLHQMFREYVLARSSYAPPLLLTHALPLPLILFSILGAPGARALPLLSESARDIIFRLPFARITENFRGRPKLDQSSKIKEGSVIGDAPGLLHVVRDCHNRVV